MDCWGRFVLWRVVYGSGCTAIAGIAPAGGGATRGYPYVDGIPRQAVNATLATADFVASLRRLPAKGARLPLTLASLLRAVALIAVAVITPLLFLTLHTQQQLTLAERQSTQWRLAESLPVGGWLLATRYRFDVQMGYLQRYQHTRDERWLAAVRRWAPDYVRVQPDPNVSFTQILLALQQRDGRGASSGDTLLSVIPE